MRRSPRWFAILSMTVGLALAPRAAGPVLAQGAPPSASVSTLGWMAGSWGGDADGVVMEEHWTVPAGGTMIGMHRDVKGDRTVLFEFLRIETRDGTLHYISSPGSRPPTVFPLKEIGAGRVVFENPTHDFPQRILYWTENGALRARIEGLMKGKPASDEWTWKPKTLAGR